MRYSLNFIWELFKDPEEKGGIFNLHILDVGLALHLYFMTL